MFPSRRADRQLPSSVFSYKGKHGKMRKGVVEELPKQQWQRCVLLRGGKGLRSARKDATGGTKDALLRS